jgi:ATP-dependent Clp protease protease subunit
MSKSLLCFIMGIVFSFSLGIWSMPSAKKVVQKPKPNAVTLYGAVTTESALKTIQQIRDLQDGSTAPIYLYIDSPGGEIFSGIKIVDAIQASKRPIYTVDIGMAASMAAWIESYGVKRYMLPHATLMYHNASGGVNGDVVRDRSQLDYLDKIILSMNTNVSKRSGVPLDTLTLKENSEWWLTADESLKNHLVDGIIDPVNYPAEKKSDFEQDN